MNQSILSKIEDNFSRLSLPEQLWLIERLIQHTRESALNKEIALKSKSSTIATDAEIQGELQQVEAELRPFGLCTGDFTVPDDFNAPLPEDIIKAFEGK